MRTYFVLAYVFSWLCWAPAVFGYDGPLADLLLFAGVWGPAAAAVTVTHRSGESVREWFKGLFVWRVPRRWYAFALGVPIALVAAVSIPFLLFGYDLDGSLLPERLAIYIPMLVFLSLAGGGNEELGWRGFALPRLLDTYSPVKASLILGGLWAVWHLPLLGAADDLSHGLGGVELTAVLAATVVNIVGLTFIYTYLYQHTRSVLLAIVLHGSFNAANGTLVLREDIEGGAYAAMQYCITFITLAVAAALVLWTHGRLGPAQETPQAAPVSDRIPQ